MSIISWGKLPSINITFFIFLFLILVACIVLSIIIVFWKSDEDKQREMKEKIELFSKICLILSIISIILFFLEIIIISVGFSKAKMYYPCFNDGDGNYTYSYSVQVYAGFFFFFKQSNDNFTSNSTISEFVDNKNEPNIRLLSSEENYVCYEEFLTSAVYGMTYFTFIISEILNIAAIFFFKELGKSKDCYNLKSQEPASQNDNRTKQNQNTNAPPIINIQTQQVIVVNNNNGTSQLINNSHQARGVKKLDKIDESKFDKKNNENNLNQNKNSNYNININNQQRKGIDYPEKEEVINSNIHQYHISNRVNQENRVGYQNNNNNNINNNINNQTIDSKDDNNIVFGSDRIKMK
jgi:hypothetical protein